MAQVCPTITATTEEDYSRQLSRLDFASRIHLDLMDGRLAPTKSPPLDNLNWPEHIGLDIHLMYQEPMAAFNRVVALKADLVIIHAEAMVDHLRFAVMLREAGIKAGIALLPDTSMESIRPILAAFDQLLIFSGNLGYQGGQADLSLLNKASAAHQLQPELEIAWDGGVNDQNAQELAKGGVAVLNVGSFISNSPDPKSAYDKIVSTLE